MSVTLQNSPASWTERAAAACPLAAVGWTADGQSERFEAVLAAIRPSGTDRERFLDFGSGTGELYEWVPIGCDYTGYDFAPGMVARARADHPDGTFTDKWPRGRFECVAAVGTFNLKASWSKQHTFHTLRHLWDTTGCRVLAASLYAGTDDRCLIYTEPELERVGAELAIDVTVERHRPNDLLLVARR